MNRKIIGIIGGGQLGRMLIQSGINYPIDFHIYSDHNDFSSQYLCKKYMIGNYNNYDKLVEFGKECDVITIEIENINIDALKYLSDTFKKKIYPSVELLYVIKDRSIQKDFLTRLSLKFNIINTMNYSLNNTFQYPIVNKLITGGYDGYGTKVLHSPLDEPFNEPSIFEEFCHFDKELSITIARNSLGDILVYPPVDMIFTDNHMLKYLICPADISEELVNKIKEIANIIATKTGLIGILSIELFLKNNEIYINELAPRPHNSAHHTQNMFNYSQFDSLIRCLLDLPLNNLKNYSQYGASVNILAGNLYGNVYYELDQLHLDDVYLHLYDKKTVKPSRKMGHINILANNYEELMKKINIVKSLIKKCIHVSYNNPTKNPLVGIIMGSESDYDKMRHCSHILEEFSIPFEFRIISAHRTPELMIEYAKSASYRGIKVIIAGAGGAAHLPGMIASITTLPVIGVPIKSSNSLDGWDSILSILQMPNGIPVATVALDQTYNAGILAMQILGMNYEISIHKNRLKDKVYQMNKNILEKI